MPPTDTYDEEDQKGRIANILDEFVKEKIPNTNVSRRRLLGIADVLLKLSVVNTVVIWSVVIGALLPLRSILIGLVDFGDADDIAEQILEIIKKRK